MAAVQPAIPMEIVDDHNRALDFIYKLIARKKIPFNGLTLVHYDSHPDLAPPADLPIEQFSDRSTLLEELSISDWILPAVYMGHISRVVWVKPHWSDQIPLGTQRIRIGSERGRLRVNSDLGYYVSDPESFGSNLYETSAPKDPSPPRTLNDTLKLGVVTVETKARPTNTQTDIERLRALLAQEKENLLEVTRQETVNKILNFDESMADRSPRARERKTVKIAEDPPIRWSTVPVEQVGDPVKGRTPPKDKPEHSPPRLRESSSESLVSPSRYVMTIYGVVYHVMPIYGHNSHDIV
eukprot:sb/3467499/